MSRRIFLSDLHVSAGHSLVQGYPKHPYDWLTKEESSRTVAFLTWVGVQADAASAAPSPVDEVVLLGDVFDNWVYPHDEKPPTMREIVASENAAPVVRALRELAEKVDVFVVVGNHDLTLDPGALAEVSPKLVHAGTVFRTGRLRAEHGHSEALCCAPDPDRRQTVPLGYFISRLAATSDCDLGTHTPTLPTIMRELIDAAEHEKIGQCILEAVCARLHLDDNSAIQMPDDLWGGEAVSIGALKNMYGDIYSKWVRRNGTMSALRSVPAELGVLEPVAATHFASGNTIVVYGHTHEPRDEGYISLRGRTVYANTGAWCKEHGTWVEVVKERGKETKVTCMQWVPNGASYEPKVLHGPRIAD